MKKLKTTGWMAIEKDSKSIFNNLMISVMRTIYKRKCEADFDKCPSQKIIKVEIKELNS